MEIKILPKLMECCGLLGAFGFATRIVQDWQGGIRRVDITEEQQHRYFSQVISAQAEHQRNCALITLSESQSSMMQLAETYGFKVVHEFYNPNSGHIVYILVRTIYANKSEYNLPPTGYWRKTDAL